jgi:hypothetical protein
LELHSAGEEQNLVSHQESVRSLLRKAYKDRVDLEIGTGREDFDLSAGARSRQFYLRNRWFGNRTAGIDEKGKAHRSREQFAQQPELLGSDVDGHVNNSTDITPRTVEARDEAVLYRVYGCAVQRNMKKPPALWPPTG